MDQLPWVPFVKILSYLSLEDRLRSRLVSRDWRDCIDSFKAASLCYSERKRGHLYEKHRLISDQFERCFIGSPKFASFFGSFASSIFSQLKHLRICSLTLKSGQLLVQALNSFGQLEELDLLDLSLRPTADFSSDPPLNLQLNLPGLQRIQCTKLSGVDELILDAPKLRRIKLWICWSLRLEAVHGEPVESIAISSSEYVDLEKFENMKHLVCFSFGRHFSETLLSSLEQLEELHTNSSRALQLLAQKQHYQRDRLKIYYRGLLLKNQTEFYAFPVDEQHFPSKERINCYLENGSRLADRIALNSYLNIWNFSTQYFQYSSIEETLSRTPAEFWRRFDNLYEIRVGTQIQSKNIAQFLQFLANLKHIAALEFEYGRPQALFDQLPGHCASIQRLTIRRETADLRFLFKLKELTDISLRNQVDEEFFRKIFKEFPFVLSFGFINRFCVEARVTKLLTAKDLRCSFAIRLPL